MISIIDHPERVEIESTFTVDGERSSDQRSARILFNQFVCKGL